MSVLEDVRIYIIDLVREHDAILTMAFMAIIVGVIAYRVLRPDWNFSNIKGERGELRSVPWAPKVPVENFLSLIWGEPRRYHRTPHVDLKFKQDKRSLPPVERRGNGLTPREEVELLEDSCRKAG